MILRVLAFLTASCFAFAQRGEWTRPFPAHKVAGNVYFVGTEDLACFLITDPKGHILINTGLESSGPMIRASVEKLGFKSSDIRVLLVMQGHYDHTAALADIAKDTGAKLYATSPDAPIIESGGQIDPSFGKDGHFRAVKVSRILKDGDKVELGANSLTVHMTPGHTKGSVSYSMNVNDSGKTRRLYIVNMGTVVMPLVGNSWYPEIAKDFDSTFRQMKTFQPDLWVSAHGSQYGLMDLYKAGKTYAAPADYLPAVERLEKRFRQQLQIEQGKK